MSDAPGDPLAHWPARTPLYDADGRLLLVFTISEHAYRNRQWADGVWRPDDVPVDEAAERALEVFSGWALSTSDSALAGELVARGAQAIRHAHSMSHDLTALPAEDPAPGLLVDRLDPTSLVDLADQIGVLLFAAYPADHPDHSHDSEDAAVTAMHRVAAGEVLGPMLDVSTVARRDGTPVGACLVVEREGDPPDGGPWVLDIFRDPNSSERGIGRALLIETLRLCRQSVLPALSLAVSHTNERALALYGALGFEEVAEGSTLALP